MHLIGMCFSSYFVRSKRKNKRRKNFCSFWQIWWRVQMRTSILASSLSCVRTSISTHILKYILKYFLKLTLTWTLTYGLRYSLTSTLTYSWTYPYYSISIYVLRGNVPDKYSDIYSIMKIFENVSECWYKFWTCDQANFMWRIFWYVFRPLLCKTSHNLKFIFWLCSGKCCFWFWLTFILTVVLTCT